ncbi:hypothetical protein J1N35_038096, partial [Gossypium stocksii]
ESTRLTWPSPCGSCGNTLATTRPCPAHGHGFVNHTVVSSHTDDHTPMWHRQIHFSAFVKALFFAFWVHICFDFDARTHQDHQNLKFIN